MNKNLIIQIFWIILVGVTIWFFYSNQSTKQATAPSATLPATANIEKTCMDLAIKKANQPNLDAVADSGNPYLTKKDIPQLRESMIKKQFAECMNIWED